MYISALLSPPAIASSTSLEDFLLTLMKSTRWWLSQVPVVSDFWGVIPESHVEVLLPDELLLSLLALLVLDLFPQLPNQEFFCWISSGFCLLLSLPDILLLASRRAVTTSISTSVFLLLFTSLRFSLQVPHFPFLECYCPWPQSWCYVLNNVHLVTDSSVEI